MHEGREIQKLDKDLEQLDADTLKVNLTLLKLTKWIAALTVVMILVGCIQLVVTWPKRTYCIQVSDTVQLCEPDYFPYDTNPADPAYELDKQIDQKIGS